MIIKLMLSRKQKIIKITLDTKIQLTWCLNVQFITKGIFFVDEKHILLATSKEEKNNLTNLLMSY